MQRIGDPLAAINAALSEAGVETIGDTAPAAAPEPAPAPAQEPAAAPVAAATPEPEATPAEEPEPAQEAAQEPEEAPAEPPAPAFDPESFAWGEWDGTDVSNFPEELQATATRFAQFYNGQMEGRVRDATAALAEERDGFKKLYEAMRDGDPDPRIAEAEEKLAEAQRLHEAAEKAVAEMEEEAKRQITEANSSYMEWFNAQYGADFLGEENEANGAKLLDLFEHENARTMHRMAEVVRLGDDAITKAKELLDAGVPEQTVLDTCRVLYKPAPAPAPEPVKAKPQRETRPAASIVSGAATRSAPPARPARPAPRSLNERLDRVLDDLLKQ